LFDGKWDVDGFEEFFGQRRSELAEVVDVLLDVFGVEAAEEVAGKRG
jgi:hypothetical protein